MKFEWDGAKARSNFGKHGVSFEEACTVFEDDFSLTGKDPDHSRAGEFRFITFGLSSAGRLLTVSHAERGERIRLISARPASRSERKFYEEIRITE
jgi:uncharacterized DUF497 family protein